MMMRADGSEDVQLRGLQLVKIVNNLLGATRHFGTCVFCAIFTDGSIYQVYSVKKLHD